MSNRMYGTRLSDDEAEALGLKGVRNVSEALRSILVENIELKRRVGELEEGVKLMMYMRRMHANLETLIRGGGVLKKDTWEKVVESESEEYSLANKKAKEEVATFLAPKRYPADNV